MIQKIALIGFGGVGQGVVKLLKEKESSLLKKYDRQFKVVSIADLYKGAVHHDEGLDLDRVIESIEKDGTLDHYPDQRGLVRGLSSEETIKQTNADTIVEMTFTNIETGEPAIAHCELAFTHKKNVVMTNKGPVALKKKELEVMAREHGVKFFYEGSVMSGTPAIRMPKLTLMGNDFIRVRGILNGTTNYMLTQMEGGMSYKEALEKAKALGYAEADPTSDVRGYDVLYKVMILASELFDQTVTKDEVPCIGITEITEEDIELAKKEGKRWKLIGTVERTDEEVKASVKPVKLDLTDPLASIEGALNAITYECDISGDITLVGAGAGIRETAFAVLVDLLHIE
ncbi:homoserine dehydrogenase [Alkalihalophilus marmarensis]|uniref:homoserine dehydrogenase n=1 Tax=Alkalihalophilus marmarensis TaxID=521377 RepID=UPI002DBBEEA2|nr:homoserine dehydrogenase [Alkalihalophilus marmarensis]MEC2070900.1 homoserine dehydrogenase [Alkalihalophilus marmarensis]